MRLDEKFQNFPSLFLFQLKNFFTKIKNYPFKLPLEIQLSQKTALFSSELNGGDRNMFSKS